jgi:hypothetical protein
VKKIIGPVRGIVAGLGLAGFLALSGSLPAFANGQPGVDISGGSLTGGTISLTDFTPVTLDGKDDTTTATWSIGNITDSRGLGTGWHLSLQMTQFKQWDNALTPPNYAAGGATLADQSLTVTSAPTVTRDSTSPDASDPGQIAPVTFGTALDGTGSAVEILSAANGYGMGIYDVTNMTVSLAIPPTTLAHTYKSDAMVTLSDAP